jgi:hypothetical protein
METPMRMGVRKSGYFWERSGIQRKLAPSQVDGERSAL